MGTTGSGKFGEYPGSGSGGKSEKNDCRVSVPEVALDDVARCQYYEAHGNLPEIGTAVSARQELFKGRIAIQTSVENEIVGFLPPRFNFLLGCMQQGYQYDGEIISANTAPVPSVVISIQSV